MEGLTLFLLVIAGMAFAMLLLSVAMILYCIYVNTKQTAVTADIIEQYIKIKNPELFRKK